jgi:hypothetical protein
VTMRTIPIDVSKLSGFMCAYAPEPNADRVTGEVRKDRDSGLDQYLVGITVRFAGTREAYVLNVQVPGEPVGVVENQAVRVHDLTASPWDRDGRSGVTYRASAVTAASAAPAAASAAVSSGADTSGVGRGGRVAS